MLQQRWAVIVMMLAAVPLTASAQAKRRLDHIVIYKDGFFLKGQVGEKVGEIIYDSKSGKAFPVLAGDFFLNDGARTIFFGHNQVNKVLPIESNVSVIKRFNAISQSGVVYPEFVFESYSKWSDAGERKIHVNNSKAGRPSFDMTQRVGLITPHYIQAFTTFYAWNPAYLTQEFGPALTRSIILKIFSEKKEYREKMTPAQRFLLLAKFMQEAGWYDEAEKELVDTMRNYPAEKKLVEERLANLKQIRANLFVESLQQASNVGQHEAVLDGLQAYDMQGYDKLVSPKHRLIIGDLRADYDKAKERMTEAKRFLKALPLDARQSGTWTKATAFIADELNLDTIGMPKGRLDTFLDFAQQFELDLKNKRKPGQSAEQVLALAVTGWLQGNQAAEPDPKMALSLVKARQFVSDYLHADFAPKRATLLSEFRQQHNLPADVMARLLRMIPPSHAIEPDSITTKMVTVPIEVPESNGGSYLLQLPPDYHPLRHYPVLMLFHSGRDKADETVKRFSEEAMKHGFILVAPLWAADQPLKAKYRGRERDHQLVMDTLRDLRRRFQIDSDRVFMFGWEDGANLVYDVGLSHPDLFAGIIPMNGTLQRFTRRFYWPHAQYLPIYIIDGDRNGNAVKANAELLKDWTRNPYQCTYVEYRGRSSEWFGAEVARVMSWISRKKRHTPMKELGRASNTRDLGEEFRSSRPLDSHFYWLSGDGFLDRNQHEHAGLWPNYFRPATFQANLVVGNTLVKKEAKTWYEVSIRASGMRQTTLWITPSMMELPNLVTVRFNGQEVWNKRLVEPSLDVLMEELYRTGDRQRLYLNKFDFRVQ